MCGISGAVGFVDDRIQDAVRAMDAAQIHRGPDGQGYWSSVAPGNSDERGVSLAHRRLAILDLSEAGAQPMHDSSTGQTIVYNGEIYNYRSIRDGLIKRGEHFVSECDTEVILRSLALDGIRSVCRFNGMFTFACWDPARRVLELARDRVGIKPLYYTTIIHDHGQKTVLFSSELRAILASGLVPRNIDSTGLNSYLWNGFVVGPHTFVDNVKLMPAGSTVSITAGEFPQPPETFWNVPGSTGENSTFAELRGALERSVERRLISDVPLGIFLSGGIDSSAIAAVASRVASGKIHTFNIGFPEADYDESSYAARVAEQLGTEHRCIELTESDFQGHLDDAMDCIDQPTFDAINTYFVSRAVRQAGITVALSGAGGDELFGGYTSFRDLPMAQRWSHWMGHLPEGMLRKCAGIVTRLKTGRPGRVSPQTRWGKLGDVLATRGELVDLYQISYSLYTEAFLDKLRLTDNEIIYGLPRQTREHLKSSIKGCPKLHAISMLELSCFIGQRLLRDTDAASMRVSLEARVPLLDHELIETVARYNTEERFNPIGRKTLLRRLALSDLDPDIFDRPKSGFVLPIDTWIRQGLKDQVRETLHDKSLCERVGLNAKSVANLWQAFQSGSPGLYWSRLWALFVVMRWSHQHDVTLVDGR